MFPVLKFTCEFTAAFHTSEQNYANLYTCAPYILGSSLRGAFLRALIDSDCTGMVLQHAPTFHHQCDEGCLVKPLFALPTRCSFGEFLSGIQRPQSVTALRTRVGIDRERQSAAQGALLSTEVRYGQFSFAIMLPDAGLQDVVQRAVEWAGTRPDSGGIGRFRSAGWGRFRILSATLEPLSNQSNSVIGSTRYRFQFRTPYVLDDQFLEESSRVAVVEEQLRKAMPASSPFSGQVVATELRLSSLMYIRRWSDEHLHKENRQVAGPGLQLLVSFDAPVTAEQRALWAWGIGEWMEAGFGSFTASPA